MHPLERAQRVADAGVGDAAERSRVEEAERAEAVVHGYHDDLLIVGEERTVVDRLG